MFGTIQGITHRVRTHFGVSEATFGGIQGQPFLHGVGQGNGAGPAIWAVVSSPLLDLLRSKGFGTKLRTPITNQRCHIAAYTFVDDTDICELPESRDTTLEQVAQSMQEALDVWEGGIRATGGALVPSKSHWYLLDFKWKQGQWAYKKITDKDVYILNPDGVREKLEHLPYWEARRTLGFHIAPDGNNKQQLEVLIQKASDWASSMNSLRSRRLAWTAFATSITPTLKYPLTTTTLTKSQCYQVMKIVYRAALPAMGVSKTFPRALASAPVRFQGLGMFDLYRSQGIIHLLRASTHGGSYSLGSNFLQVSLENLQVSLRPGLP